MTSALLTFLTEYFENVRELAQNIVLYFVSHFIPANLSFSKGQEEALQTLKANALIGWGESMKAQVRDAADMEAELSKHLFADP